MRGHRLGRRAEGIGVGGETGPFPSFSAEARRPGLMLRSSKIEYMEVADFIDAIFEFLKKEGWLRH